MRTSKKGGRGGTWGAQPSGQSGAAALVSPVTHYESSAAASVGGKILRGFGWFLLAVIVIGAGIAGGVYLYDQHTLQSIEATGATKRATSKLQALPSVNGPAIALVAGYDHRAGTGTNAYAGSNSDTLMLLRADPTTDTLSLLSFPRDLNVPIYCTGDTASTNDRINAAWADCGANGGPLAAVNTMEHLTGLKINYLITLDFNAFKRIVDRLHGVYLNVDRRYYIPPNTGTSAINLLPGYQKLDGGQALQYVRFRHFDSDLYRNGRQQLFMEALKQRVKSELSPSNFLLLPKLVGALHGNLQVGKAGGGALTNQEVLSYLGLIKNLPPGHQIRNAIPIQDLTNFVTASGADELQASPGTVAAVVHRFLHPFVPAVHHTPKGNGTKTPHLPRKTISVLVLNAGSIAGEASNTSYLLGKHGFVTKTLPATTPANAPVTLDTVVYYDPSQANGQKAAEELAPLFGSHTSVAQMTAAIASIAHKAGDPLTVAAIGTSFNGRLKFPRPSRPPSKSTANAQVQNGIPVALAAVRSKNGPAHFTLMVPHKVAVGSSLATDDGARLFKPLRGKQELVLTFNLPSGIEYWQVEESNWTTEPLLADPTAHFTYKGREYQEYTSGGKIQEIAVRYGHSIYWVQNTILNKLSNATMIAIAEGLQPLH
jgi:LCP family protein required for cell wall assembly